MAHRGALEKVRPFSYAFNMKLNIKEPYDDDKMRFDNSAKRYVLTLEYAKAEFPDTFRDDGVLSKRLNKNSRKVYDFIYYRGASCNRSVVEFLINRTEQGREFILQVLAAQMEADAESGYNDLSSTPAINVSNGQVIDRNLLAQNQICVDAEQIIDGSASYFGQSIVSRTQFPFYYFVMAGSYR